MTADPQRRPTTFDIFSVVALVENAQLVSRPCGFAARGSVEDPMSRAWWQSILVGVFTRWMTTRCSDAGARERRSRNVHRPGIGAPRWAASPPASPRGGPGLSARRVDGRDAVSLRRARRNVRLGPLGDRGIGRRRDAGP